MLLTPYLQTFGIQITPLFVGVTLAAHLIFGVSLGWSARWLARRDAFSGFQGVLGNSRLRGTYFRG